MKPAILHSQARAELDEAVAWYERQAAGLGLDLLSGVEQAIERIQENPEMGGRHHATEFRFSFVRRFPYAIFHLELSDVVWIAAIAHASRQPDYWRGREFERGG